MPARGHHDHRQGTEAQDRGPAEPAPVTVERPPEREAPLTVDASTEFFPTPAAVADRMIAAAGLEAEL